MPEWGWIIDCEFHGFHADHYKKSIVIRKTKAHIAQTGCANIDCEDIRRAPLPNDLNIYPAREDV